MLKDTDGTRTVPTRDNRNELRMSVEAADRLLRSNSIAPRCGRIVEALLISYVDTRGIGSMYPFGEVPRAQRARNYESSQNFKPVPWNALKEGD